MLKTPACVLALVTAASCCWAETLAREARGRPTVSLDFSTYWGTGGAANRSVCVDRAGNIYMAGGTKQTDWPTTTGRIHGGGGESDVTVAKFAPDGKLIWSTLLGGPLEDYAYVSAVSDRGELYVSGRAGPGFPTTPGAFDRTFNGGIGGGPHRPTDAFVVKLSPEGDIVWATYLGGNGDENGRAIHLLPSGKLIVAGGNTTSTDLPTDRGTLPGPVLKPRRGGNKDSWVALVAADGGSLEFCTYFGPSDDRMARGDETIRALGLDRLGNIWIGGTTHGSDITPTADAFQKIRGGQPPTSDTFQKTRGGQPPSGNAFQKTRGGPPPTGEAYVAKLSPDGKRLVYFSWLGGSGNDEVETEGVSDAAGNFYIAGATASADFPTSPGAFQSELKGGGPGAWDGDGWVARINHDGSLGLATLYGGTTVGPEGFFGPAVDPSGNVYCTGRFRSPDCPVTADAFQKRKAGPPNVQDAVLVVFSADGRRLLYGSYFGGSGPDCGRHLGVQPDGRAVCIIGETASRDIPLIHPPRRASSGAFLAQFAVAPGR